jgi:hypothetical protein
MSLCESCLYMILGKKNHIHRLHNFVSGIKGGEAFCKHSRKSGNSNLPIANWLNRWGFRIPYSILYGHFILHNTYTCAMFHIITDYYKVHIITHYNDYMYTFDVLRAVTVPGYERHDPCIKRHDSCIERHDSCIERHDSCTERHDSCVTVPGRLSLIPNVFLHVTRAMHV